MVNFFNHVVEDIHALLVRGKGKKLKLDSFLSTQGAEIINDTDGLVHFTYGYDDIRKHEYMRLVLDNGKWLISSF